MALYKKNATGPELAVFFGNTSPYKANL